MITYRELSRPLRLAVAAPWCLLLGLAGTAATPAFRQLLLDPSTDQPTTAVNLSGPRWTGTLDAARLPDDPTAGKSLAPASVMADGLIQTGDCFLSSTSNFYAGDFGVYLRGFQIADAYGNLCASDHLAAPAAYVETLVFPDGSQLSSNGSEFVRTDPNGLRFTVVTIPAP